MKEQSYKNLQELLQIRSYTGEENNALNFIEQKLISSEINCFRQEENLIVYLKGGNSKKCLIFDSHVDTVSADLDKWNDGYPPYGVNSGKIHDGKIIGLGASDMKSGAFVQLELIKKLKNEENIPCDIWFIFVPGEETDGHGTKSFCEWFFKQNFKYEKIGVAIPEPIKNGEIYFGQRGNWALRAITSGNSGHASSINEDNKSAILKMVEFLTELNEKSREWKKNLTDKNFGKPTMTITSISSGDKNFPNKLSPDCEATIDIRTSPQSHTEIFDLLQALANEKDVKIENCWPDVPSFCGDSESALIKIAENVTRLKPKIYPAATDLGWFLQKGVTQAIIYGPGDYSQAHQPNEYANLKNIDDCVKNYLQIIQNWGI